MILREEKEHYLRIKIARKKYYWLSHFSKKKRVVFNIDECLSENVVAVAFEITFLLEMHQNDMFIFLKLFLTSAYQNYLKTPKKLI